MISKKIRVALLGIVFLLIFSGCGSVKDRADTPFNEEKILELQKDQETDIYDEECLTQPENQERQIEDASDINSEKINEEVMSESEQIQEESTYTEASEGEVVPGADLEIEEEAESVPQRNVCTLSVKCDTILLNIDKLAQEKLSVVPEDGIIYSEREIEFQPNESVFDVLHREMKNSGIHMEFTETPMYNSIYIKGINNLYEFDCGDLSGWVYRVNGEMGNIGCSQYIVKQGDHIEWLYSCDMGRDI